MSKITNIPKLLMKLRFPGVHTISVSYYPVLGIYQFILRRSGGPKFNIPLCDELVEDVFKQIPGAEASMVDYIIREHNAMLREELLDRYAAFATGEHPSDKSPPTANPAGKK